MVMTYQSFGPWIYGQEWVVAKILGPEESVQDMIDSITDAGSTKRYGILVAPGIYNEDIVMEEYVDVVCSSGEAVIKPEVGDTIGVTMADNSTLAGFKIDMVNGATTGIAIGVLVEVIVEGCWVTNGGDGDAGITDASTGDSVRIRRCRVDSSATSYQKTGTGTTWFADNRVTCATDGIDVDINAGSINLMDNELMGTGTGANVDVAAAAINVYSYGNTLSGDGWQIGSLATAKVWSHNDKFTKVTHAGLGFMVATEEPQVYLVHAGMHIGDALTDITDATDTKRYTIKVFSGEYNEAVVMEEFVDLVGVSSQSVVIYQAAATVITPANNSRIRSVRVEVTAADGGIRGIEADAVDAILEDCVVSVTGTVAFNHAIHTTNNGTVTLYKCTVIGVGTGTYALTLTNASTSTLYDSSFSGSDDTYDIFLTSNATVNSYDCKLLNNGWYIGDYVDVSVRSYGDDYTEVTFEGTMGFFADLTGARLYSCASGVAIGEWVYVSGNDAVTEASALALATMPTIGRVVYKPTTTTCYVKNYGYAYDVAANAGHGDAWVFGQEYWVSTTAGEITTTMPAVWPQRAGIAVSTQRFKILIGDNLGLVHTNTFSCSGATEAVLEWVYISGTDTVDEADASDPTKMLAVGMIVEKPTAILAVVKTDGKVLTTGKGWTPNDPVYISDTTPGDIVRVPPGMGTVQRVGTVVHDDGGAVVNGLLIELM